MTTLVKNNVGNLCSIVKPSSNPAPSFDGQEYVPIQYLYDTELNEWVSFYWTNYRIFGSSSGAQCLWLDNNAEVDNEEQFGIKLTSINLSGNKAKVAAYAMYQRQKKAAEEDLAPPVYGMCCFKTYDKDRQELNTYWGYLSCVGDTESVLETFMDADDCEEYQEYLYQQQDKHEQAASIKESLENLDIYGRALDRIMDSIYEEIGLHPDDICFSDWCDQNGYSNMIDGFCELRDCLESLSIAGLQRDWNPIGNVFDCSHMGGDLHKRNLALWQGELVAIDFGHHCVQ
jgi:hypothetical protein